MGCKIVIIKNDGRRVTFIIVQENDLFLKEHFICFYYLSGSCVDTAIWMHYLDANKTAGEKARRQLHKHAASNIEQVLEATPHKAPTIPSPTSHLGIWISLIQPIAMIDFIKP